MLLLFVALTTRPCPRHDTVMHNVLFAYYFQTKLEHELKRIICNVNRNSILKSSTTFILNTGHACVGNFCLLISDAVYSGRYAPIFKRNVPPPSSALLYPTFLLLFLLVVFQARNFTSILLNFFLFFWLFCYFIPETLRVDPIWLWKQQFVLKH
jgi:hypothetical protein